MAVFSFQCTLGQRASRRVSLFSFIYKDPRKQERAKRKMKKKNNSAATRSTTHPLNAFIEGFGNSSHTREHYNNSVRHLLSRRAKAFLRLMQGQMPRDVMEYVAWELAAETRRDQNLLAQQLFNILIDSNQCDEPEDERLRLKLDELASVVCCNVDLREQGTDDYDNDYIDNDDF